MATANKMTNYFAYMLPVFSLLRGLSAQDILTFSSKEEEQLECSLGNANSVQWATGDEGLSLCYYPDSSGDVTFANNDTKYMNFNCSLIQANVNLIIRNVEKDDGGSYICTPIPGIQVSYSLTVEALPDFFGITCSNSPLRTCGGPDEVITSSVDCICTARQVSPRSLQLQWSISPSNVKREETNDAGAYYNLISEVTVTPTSTEESVNCSLTGYQSEGIDGNLKIRRYNFVPPSCTLEVISYDDMCTTAALSCECSGGMPDTYTYSFFHRNKSKIVDSDTSTIKVDISAGEAFKFYCRGCNGIYGETSLTEISDVCNTGIRISPPATSDTMTGDDTITVPSSTSDVKTGCPRHSAPALIAICCVEGVTIIALVFVFGFLYTIRKGSRKEVAQSLTTHPYNATDKTNTAYMDLQETKQLSSNHVNVDIPFENLSLQAPFPSKGLMKYRKAQMTLTSKREEIVVKTVSDDAPVRLAKLQTDEVRILATLTSNANVAQFLGRCNNVPNLLCYEFVNGTKLGEYLRENFQPSKIHQYGNTKQKRYHVPEKGSVESLPRLALQISRGMKYLTAQKFLHPGLRSEKVIIDASGQCKLYDFVSNDNAKDILAILWGKFVPYQWMPPEYLFLEKLEPSVDVWSFGVLVWEIFSYGAVPHKGKSRNDVEKELRGKENLPLPNNCPGAIWQITLNCWDQSPEKRPSFHHLSLQLSHMCNDNKEYDEIQSK